MIEDRRRLGTIVLIVGFILFIIGMFDNMISDWAIDFSDRIRIFGWGWLFQIAGGIFIIYGLMIHLEAYLVITRLGYPQGPSPLPPAFIMDPETKKLIWVISIALLVMYVISPGVQCQSLLIILMIIGIILLVTRGGQHIRFPYPPPNYPPPQMPRNVQQVSRPQAPPRSHKVKICEKCYAQLELEWVACPKCGHSIFKKAKENIKK